MNQTMRRLTLATIIFFPLTFLTSYFGMNFTSMPSIEGSDLLYVTPASLLAHPPHLRTVRHKILKQLLENLHSMHVRADTPVYLGRRRQSFQVREGQEDRSACTQGAPALLRTLELDVPTLTSTSPRHL